MALVDDASKQLKVVLLAGGYGMRISEETAIKPKPFLLTYGDGLSDVNIRDLVNYHVSYRKLATVTSVQPAGKAPWKWQP